RLLRRRVGGGAVWTFLSVPLHGSAGGFLARRVFHGQLAGDSLRAGAVDLGAAGAGPAEPVPLAPSSSAFRPEWAWMHHVDLTRGTVWLALAFYVAREWSGRGGMERGVSPLARWLNSFGCLAFIAHVVCAFQFYHHWSHAAAYADTARRTGELTGWNW